MVQLSHPYMTTAKTIALTVWIFVGKVMSLLFNMFVSPPQIHMLKPCGPSMIVFGGGCLLEVIMIS